MDYGMQAFSRKEILEKGMEFPPVDVIDSIEDEAVTPYVDESVCLLLKEGENVSFGIRLPKYIQAPIKKDQKVGELTVLINKKPYQVLSLHAKENRRRITYGYILKSVLFRYICGWMAL